MKKIKHLTEKQLLSYAKGSSNKEESQEVGKHLLQCNDCRIALPIPTPNKFLAILVGDGTQSGLENVTQKELKSILPVSMFSKIKAFIERPLTMAWSSGAIVLILSISSLVWINSSIHNQEEQLGREVAASIELKNTELATKLALAKEKNIEPVPTDLKKERKTSKSEESENNRGTNRIQQRKKINKHKVKSSSRSKIKVKKIIKNLKKGNRILSTTRGVIPDCKEKKNFNVELASKEKKVVFNWKKVPNAKKYHLYISDDEEVLIDEFETENATSYILSKKLDVTKTYKWKILIIMENGETIVGQSEKFTVNDVQMEQKEIKGKNKLPIRCSEKS